MPPYHVRRPRNRQQKRAPIESGDLLQRRRS